MKTITCASILLMGFLIGGAPWVHGQSKDGDAIVIGQYRTLDSKVLGEQRRVLVNLPTGYETSDVKYPVVFHLYGDFVMTYFADAASFLERLQSFRMIPGVILVGVDNTDRYRDLRPVKPDGTPGGADQFAHYFREELIPFIEQNYRVADYRILVGPQAGACFGYYSLMEHPDLFNAYILENSFDNPPKIDDYLISKARDFFNPGRSLPKFLYLKTDSKSPNYPFSLEQQSIIEKNSPLGLRYKFEIADQGDYLIETGFINGFMELFSGYELPDSVAIGGLEMILDYYGKLSDKIGYGITVSDNTLHMAASRVNSAGNKPESKKIYEYLLSLYPKSLDGMFQMGMILASEGKYDEAINYYKEFLKIRPQEAIVKNILARTERMLNEAAADR